MCKNKKKRQQLRNVKASIVRNDQNQDRGSEGDVVGNFKE